MQKTIVADNVSMCFNLASERVDSLKDLLIKKSFKVAALMNFGP